MIIWNNPFMMQNIHPAVLVFLIVFVAPIIGALLFGADRKVTSRIQGRMGPPLIQPIHDFIKLIRKEPIVVNGFQIIFAYLHLAFMIIALLLLYLGQDLLMIIFVLAFSTISLILGGMSVRSPYSRIGAQREILQMVAYEPIIVFMVIGIYLTNGSFLARDIYLSAKPLLFSLPLIFISLLVAITIKMQKSPFDFATSHHAHQEIVKGVTIEYSGPYLAVLELTHFYEIFFLLSIIGLFWTTNVFVGISLALLSYFAIIVVDNAYARLTTMWMLRFMWTIVLGLALTNIIWLYL